MTTIAYEELFHLPERGGTLNVNFQCPNWAEKIKLLVLLSRSERRKSNNLGSKRGVEQLRVTPWSLESLGPNSRHAGFIERACKSPPRLTDAGSNAVFSESAFKYAD